jgi:hypothetical protein
MHQMLAHAGHIHQLQRNVVILPARQARAQTAHLDREGETHLDAGVKAFKVALIVVQRVFDHTKGKILFRMGIKGPHDAAHVDALLLGLQRHSAGHAGLQGHRAIVAGLEADRQAEVGNADVLDGLLGTPDQAGRAILQIGERVFIRRVRAELGWVVARQDRIALPQKRADLRIQTHNIGLRGTRGPKPQRGKSGFGLGAAGTGVFV